MVSIENRINYVSNIAANTKLKAFRDFIYGDPVIKPGSELKEIDEIYFSTLKALAADDKREFDKSYRQLKKRKVNSESAAPFIYDDALIFSLILGIVCYGHDQQWIQQILEIRTSNDITATFKSLLKEDYFNKSNLSQIVIPFLQLSKKASPPESYVNETYRNIIGTDNLFENRSDFLILLSLNTYDWIILSKDTEEGALERFKNFESFFLKRTKWIAIVIYNAILAFVIYGIWKALALFPGLTEDFNEVATIVGLLGIQVIANVITGLRLQVEKLVRKSLGYWS
jgi:hypothetical protein